GEGQVVVAPVHPLPEPPGLAGHHADVVRDAFAAAVGELGEPVLLDLTLRVQAESLLDLDLHPEPLAVEAVLVALVEAAQRLVALEDVLERPTPRVMHTHRVVRRDRPVDEAPARATAVLLAQAVEGLFALPEVEDLELERRVIGLVRKR